MSTEMLLTCVRGDEAETRNLVPLLQQTFGFLPLVFANIAPAWRHQSV
jgi:hypothetical protein